MARVEVLAGVCGFESVIKAEADAMYQVTLHIDSDCAQIKAMGEALPSLSALDEMRLAINEATPYRVASACKVHAACPVPCAIIKAMEVACGLALPADVTIKVSRT